jgi:hypothetical protein
MFIEALECFACKLRKLLLCWLVYPAVSCVDLHDNKEISQPGIRLWLYSFLSLHLYNSSRLFRVCRKSAFFITSIYYRLPRWWIFDITILCDTKFALCEKEKSRLKIVAFVSFLIQVYSVIGSVPRLVFMSCASLSFSNHHLRFPDFRIPLVGKDDVKTSFLQTYSYIISVLLRLFVKIEKLLIEH